MLLTDIFSSSSLLKFYHRITLLRPGVSNSFNPAGQMSSMRLVQPQDQAYRPPSPHHTWFRRRSSWKYGTRTVCGVDAGTNAACSNVRVGWLSWQFQDCGAYYSQSGMWLPFWPDCAMCWAHSRICTTHGMGPRLVGAATKLGMLGDRERRRSVDPIRPFMMVLCHAHVGLMGQHVGLMGQTQGQHQGLERRALGCIQTVGRMFDTAGFNCPLLECEMLD